MPERKPKNYSKYILIIQIAIFAILYIALFFFLRKNITDLSQIITAAEDVYGVYGYYLIFLGAFIEGTFLIGFYIPGSLIVFLGVSLARMGITSFPLVILFGTLGFTCGYSLNYFLGRYGWYKLIEGVGFESQIKKTKEKIHGNYDKALFWGYIMPSTGSMLSTVSGILHIPFKKFLIRTLLIQTFWSLVLGGLAYAFGMNFINMFLIYFGLIALAGILIYVLNKTRKKTPNTPV